MLRNRKYLIPAAAGLAAISATALMAGSGAAHSDFARCEISTTTSGGMTTLQGVVHADQPISGSYVFRVETVGGSGSSNIRQGGGFSASPGEPEKLGSVMLSSAGSVFEATLELDTSNGRLECSKRTGAL